MKRCEYALDDFVFYLRSKRVFCLGAGNQGRRFAQFMSNWNLEENLKLYADNNKKGEFINEGKKSYKIISLEELVHEINLGDILVIASIYSKELIKQMEKLGAEDELEYVILDEVALNQLNVSNYSEIVKNSKSKLIPSVINYVWVGKEMPDNVKRNIDNWQKICSGYEFVRWDESNYDMASHEYLRQAYEKEKWGFVPDYLRLDIIYKYGGIYLDTDTEIIKKPDDLLYQDCFACVDGTLTMNLGSGFGARAGCEIIRELRDYYNNVFFLRSDGTIDMTSCNTHSYNVLKKYGYVINDRFQKIKEMNIYPMIFQGANAHLKKTRTTDKTFWIHYGDMSWM